MTNQKKFKLISFIIDFSIFKKLKNFKINRAIKKQRQIEEDNRLRDKGRERYGL